MTRCLSLLLCATLGCVQQESATTARWRLVEVMRVGVGERGEPYEFTKLAQVVSTTDAVFVSQSEQQEIRVFDTAGKYQRTIGRQGNGPGEFSALWAFGIYADTLWTLDVNLRRLSLFTTGGRLLTTIPFEPMLLTLGSHGSFFATYPVARQRDGILLGFGGTSGQAIASGLVKATPLLRMTATGRTTDTLGWVSLSHEHMILRSAHGASYRAQPFGDGPLTVYAATQRRIFVVDRRVATSDAASYGVVALTSAGDTAWSRRFAYAPIAMDRRMTDSVRSVMHRAYGSRYPVRMIDDSLFVPTVQPPVSEAIAGDDGTLWLRREEWAAKTRYDVVDATGALRATVDAGRSLHLFWASGTTAWGEELDENDVPRLVKYRIERAAGH